MNHAITRCPKCRTSFRVTPAQLDSAKGVVRCGSCLHIFDARSNLIQSAKTTSQPTTAKRTASKAAPAASKRPAEKAATTQQPASNAATAAAPQAKPSPAPVRPAPAERVSSPLAKAPTSEPSNSSRFLFDEEAEESANQPQPMSAEEEDFLISDDMDKTKSTAFTAEEEDNPFSLDDLSPEYTAESWTDDSRSLFEINRKQPEEEDDDEFHPPMDESWAKALLEDDYEEDLIPPPMESDDEKLRQEIANRFDGRQTGSFDALPDDFDTDFENFVSGSDRVEQPTPIENKFALDSTSGEPTFDLDNLDDSELDETLVPEREEKHSLLDAFEPEPIELTFEQRDKRRWLIRTGWIVGNALLVLLLIAQIGYLKFDTWSRAQPYRQWYAIACPVLGCTLPTLHDTSKIRISLVVRGQPDAEGMLLADAILINTAEFEQPFPTLALRFSDMNDKLVTERIFTPKEYLRGELSGIQLMPSGQPVQLSLELADPGQDAVNYRAYIPNDN
ncbi:DUF3426 domain-containing protein [Halioxenophilus sp. WMMB6]|uniref:DUF3426 domain-containing protein n=1 Tax=Halioxenophilus sp. WMMB6 TaxID=3073815 RepID=UPI00295EC7AA|nr:DUF3426 domain-containing protein [Halioxenophilus sp. WMMB6]